ncbi:MAG TPA: hypothetical protein VLA64_14610 [Azonexus sp.]|nr:hypothetical protein [Azonexus sp.]
MTHHAPLKKQRGVALWMLLVAVIMAGGFAFYKTSNIQFNRTGQDAKLMLALAKAKEALIAYAVTDNDRPGSLPCPDLATNSAGFSNIPGDGKSDMFTVNQCPTYVGWLPWVTLDLPELTDDTGTRLWFVLAPALRNHDSAQPINSDTPTGLQVDGNNDIAALVIASRTPLSGQNRPSNNPADYLDGENGNGSDHKYISGPQSAVFNDIVLIITRQELMAAVEKRVANELKSCLSQHALSSANTDHRYPWPAPLNATSFQGKSGSLFGRVPDTQPGSGLEAALKMSIAKLTQAQALVTAAPTATKQLAALNTLSEAIIQARNLFDAIFASTNKIKQTADDAVGKLQNIENSITLAGNRISRSEGETIRTLADATDATLDALPEQLVESGIDVFPWELARRRTPLSAAKTITELVSSTQAIQSLLVATTTPRTDISPHLAAATSAANIAYAAAQTAALTPGDITLQSAAQAAANTLLDASASLVSSVEASRINMRASEADNYVAALEELKIALRASTTQENKTALLVALSTTKTSIESILTGLPDVTSAKNTTVAVLIKAITEASKTLPDYSLIDTDTTAAINEITSLTALISSNEAVDNNVSHTSLVTANLIYKTARTGFTLVDTAVVRPLQSSIAPYAETLGDAAVNIHIWAKSISDNAAIVAPLAKANTVANDINPADASVLDTSAYKIASDALSSITGKNESAQLLQAYINTPNAENESKAITALAETSGQVNSVINQANAIDNSLSSTTASATPIIWLSSRCDFLLPNSMSWWKKNLWANAAFYQISAPLQASPGKLTVNGSGSHRLVTLLAGRPLAGQNRATATVANYLEDSNADITRDGSATSPSISFTTKPPSASFNDRLAY